MTDINVLPFKSGFDVDRVNIENRIAINQGIVRAIAENPLVRIDPEYINVLGEATLEDYMAYIRGMRTTIWAHFSVGSEKGLRQAAEWLQATVRSVVHSFENH